MAPDPQAGDMGEIMPGEPAGRSWGNLWGHFGLSDHSEVEWESFFNMSNICEAVLPGLQA